MNKHKWSKVRHEFIREHPKPYKCYYCNTELLQQPPKEHFHQTLTVDHKKPRDYGGEKYDFKNLCLCCWLCNSRRNMIQTKPNLETKRYLAECYLKVIPTLSDNFFDYLLQSPLPNR